MKAEAVLAALEAVAADIGVKLSYESLRSTVGIGGLCKVKGEYRIIVERRAGPNERIAALAQAVAEFDVGNVEMPRAARDFIAIYQRGQRGDHALRPVPATHVPEPSPAGDSPDNADNASDEAAPSAA